MIAENSMMVGAATIFVVSHMPKSVEYYRDVLGFTVTFQYGNLVQIGPQAASYIAAHGAFIRSARRRARPHQKTAGAGMCSATPVSSAGEEAL